MENSKKSFSEIKKDMMDSSTKLSTPKKDGGIWDVLRVVIEALLIAMLIRTFAFQPFNIPSGSMISNLLIGDYLFVSKYAYGYSKHSFPLSLAPIEGRIWDKEPTRGDVIVFKLPRDGETDYIKRLVGLPGDRVQMIDGLLHINGKPVKKEADGFYEIKDSFGRNKQVQKYRETLPNGVSYDVIEIEGNNSYMDNTKEFLVPPGHYFMMGDNRDNSADSRDFSSQGVGYVPYENLVGRAEIIFFSIDGGGKNLGFLGNIAYFVEHWSDYNVRWGRIFKVIR